MSLPLPPELINSIINELRSVSFRDLLNLSLTSREMALVARQYIFERVTLTYKDTHTDRSQAFLDFIEQDRGGSRSPIVSIIKEVHVIAKGFKDWHSSSPGQSKYIGPNVEQRIFQQLAKMNRSGLELRILRWTTEYDIDPDNLSFIESNFQDVLISIHLLYYTGITQLPKTSSIVAISALIGTSSVVSLTPIFRNCPRLLQLTVFGRFQWESTYLTNAQPSGETTPSPPLEIVCLSGIDCSSFAKLYLRRVESLTLDSCFNIQPLLRLFRTHTHDPVVPRLRRLTVREVGDPNGHQTVENIELLNTLLVHSSAKSQDGGLEELDLVGTICSSAVGKLIGEHHGVTLKRLRLFSYTRSRVLELGCLDQLEVLGKNCYVLEELCISCVLDERTFGLGPIVDILKTPIGLFPKLQSLTIATDCETRKRYDINTPRPDERNQHPLLERIDEHFFDGLFASMVSLRRVRLELGAKCPYLSDTGYYSVVETIDWEHSCTLSAMFTLRPEINTTQGLSSRAITMNIGNPTTDNVTTYIA